MSEAHANLNGDKPRSPDASASGVEDDGGRVVIDTQSLDPSEDVGFVDPEPRSRALARYWARFGMPPGASAAPSVDEDGRIRSGRLAGLSLGRAVWVLSWPILVQSFLASLVGLTDTVLAAGISEPATDAIGGAAYVLWFVGLVMMAIGVGATALISRAIGAGRKAAANAAVGQSILLASVSGVIVGGLVAGVAGPVSHLLNMSPEARDDFRIYILICAAGVPLNSVMYSGIECCRAAGDALRPLWAMVWVNVVNMIAAWGLSGVNLMHPVEDATGKITQQILVHNPSPLHLGVEGIALGTMIGYVVGTTMIVWLLIRGSTGVRLRLRRMRPHWITLRRLVRVGLPNFFETFGMWAGNFLVLLAVGWIPGAGLLGSHIVAIRIEALSFLPGFAMGVAAAALAGQYLGAGSPRLARHAIVVCQGVAIAFMGLGSVMFILFPRTIVGLFSSQPTHLHIVPTLLMITGTTQIPFAVSIVLRSAMRGAGDVKSVAYLTWFSTYAVRLPMVYLCSGIALTLPGWLGGRVIENPLGLKPSLEGLWVGLCLEVLVRGILFAWRFAGGKWATQRV
jgi:Na+-driven multidrug efflux pump